MDGGKKTGHISETVKMRSMFIL